MVDPVAAQDLLLATITAAAVVLLGALYAALYAIARIFDRALLLYGAYASYLCLAATVVVFAEASNLTGIWQWLVAAMLGGYLFGPPAVWRLCVGTHRHVDETDAHHEESSPRSHS